MSPSNREREHARRRQEAWQRRQAQQAAERRRRRAGVLKAVAVAAVALLVLVGAWWIGFRDPAGSSEAAAPASSADACPAPTSAPPAEPLQLDAAPDASAAQSRTWTATLATSCGDIGLELDGAAAPQAVASFVTLAQEGFFAGTPCHRLTTQGIFVLQCGDPTGEGTGGPGYSFGPIENAPADDVYPAGTLAMARRGGDAESMGSQFFLVYEDSTIPSDDAGGYTVFGRITSGLDVVQQVAAAGASGGTDGAPSTPISIEQVTVQ